MISKENIVLHMESLAAKRRDKIRNADDLITVFGTAYYVSKTGNDENDGTRPESAWKSLERVSSANLMPGDGVFFRRGDTFRGYIDTKPGVTYAAYGNGPKPKMFGWIHDLAAPDLWTKVDGENNLWKLNEMIPDCGTLVFNGGEVHSRKLIPSYIDGRFVCRNDEDREFVMADEMTEDLDLYWHFESRLTTRPSKGMDFPIPEVDENSFGELYLRCNGGNPGSLFDSIEALPKRAMFRVGDNDHVHIDNICMKYIGLHAVQAGGSVDGLHVKL